MANNNHDPEGLSDEYADIAQPDLDALADAANDAGTIAPRPSRRELDTDGRIDTDLPCIQCDYNLRGQLPQGSCPECGLAVAESMRSDRLGQADPRWLGTLRKSTTWLMLGGFTMILMSCLNGALRQGYSGRDVSETIQLSASVCQSIFFCVGYWMLTIPEPRAYRDPLTRSFARWPSVVGHGMAILVVLATLMLPAYDRGALIMIGLLQLVSLAAVFTGFCAALIYLRQLARRMPNRSLARQTTTVLWGWIATIATVFIGMTLILVMQINNAQSMGSMRNVFLMVICPIAIAVLVFLVWWLLLISVYSKCFAQAARSSRLSRREQQQADDEFY